MSVDNPNELWSLRQLKERADYVCGMIDSINTLGNGKLIDKR